MIHRPVRDLSCKPNIYLSESTLEIMLRSVLSNMFKPSSNFHTDHYKAVLLLWILFVTGVSCHTVLSFPCSIVLTCWERVDILALLYVMFSYLFVTFRYGVLSQVMDS